MTDRCPISDRLRTAVARFIGTGIYIPHELVTRAAVEIDALRKQNDELKSRIQGASVDQAK